MVQPFWRLRRSPGRADLQPLDATTIKLLYGRAIRAPDAYEQDYAASTVSSSPALTPEHIQSYELVFEQQLDRHIRLTLDPYYNQISNLITASQFDPATGDAYYTNANSAYSRGIETEVEGQWAHGIRTRASYTWQETRDGATGAELTNSPRDLAKLNLLVPFFDDKVSLGLELQYTSSSRVSSTQKTHGYFVTNVTLYSHEILKNTELSLSIYNLFDAHYGYPASPVFLEPVLPAEGRSLRLKLTCSF